MSFEFGVNMAMIGDEDITYNIKLESYPSYRKIKYLEYYFERFADISEVIRLTDEVLTSKYDFDLIMLFPVLWDLIYMEFNEFNIPSIHLNRDYNTLDNIISLIGSAQKRWKATYPNVTIFWCMPFTPDFYRFNRSNDFWKEQDNGRSFYRIIRKLGSDLYANIPGINLLDLHECYFLKFSICENSFYQNVDEPLRYIHSCTIDGLHISKEFVSNFVSVFESRVYPVVLESNRKYSIKSDSISKNYDHQRPLPMRIFDYTTETFKSGTSDNLNFESDHQISRRNYADRDNTMTERSLSESRNFHVQSNNQTNYNRDSQIYPYQSDESGSYKNLQTQSSYFNDNKYGENSNASYEPNNDNFNQNIMNKYLPDGSNSSLTNKKMDNTSSRSLMEELSSFFQAEDSNASGPKTSWEDQPQRSVSNPSPAPSSSLKNSEVKQNIGNDILKGLSDISPNIFNNLKNALSFLGSSNVIDNKVGGSSNITGNIGSGLSYTTNQKDLGSSENKNDKGSRYYKCKYFIF